MQIFEQLDDILTSKKNKIQENEEYEKDFVPYMVQRWVSMYSDDLAKISNCSSNIYWKVMQDKTVWYQFMTGVLPICKKKRIKYIKKKSEERNNKYKLETLKYIAQNQEISEREVKEYLNSEMVDIKSIKKQLE